MDNVVGNKIKEATVYQYHQHNMGILVNAEDQQALDEGICRAVDADASAMQANARSYAETYLSIGKIMSRFEETVVQSQN